MQECPELCRILTDFLRDEPIRSLRFSHLTGGDRYLRYTLSAPRAVILLSGTKHYFIDTPEGRREEVLTPDSAFYVTPFSLLAPGPLSEYDMIGLVFQPEFIRVIRLINCRDSGLPPGMADFFHHSEHPLSPAGNQMLRLLNEPDEMAPPAAVRLFQALLHETAACLNRPSGEPSRSRQTWTGIKNYIQENLTDPGLCRDQVAAAFQVTPSYVSQLFARYDRLSFNDCVNRERIDLAMHLLRHTVRPQQEVARQCGFGSPEYFIKVFRRLSGRTPGAFRASLTAAPQLGTRGSM